MRFAAACLAAIVLSSGVALACSCPDWRSAARHAEQSDAIFRARVIETQAAPVSIEGHAITIFELVDALKLPAEFRALDRIEIRHFTGGGGMCGVEFSAGAELLVIANVGANRQLYTDACSAPRWPEREYRRALHVAD